MKAFTEYVESLESLLPPNDCRLLDYTSAESIEKALNGQPAAELRRLVPLSELKESGAFFTGSKLAQFALKNFLQTIDHTSVVLDPACGAGDLLIACATRLPNWHDSNSTLNVWGKQILGRDLHSEFVQAAKLRLLLAVLNANEFSTYSRQEINLLFPNVKVGCGMSDEEAFHAATHIVVNPPFTIVNAPKDCSWGNGSVNAAALFMEAICKKATEGTRIAAILPDVLRSGSRYEKWRNLIGKYAQLDHIELFGKFDNLADVDVFIVELKVQREFSPREHQANWQPSLVEANKRVGDLFSLCIGPVVDYRDPHEGNWQAFVSTKSLPPWETIYDVPDKRKFEKRLIVPPFVVVRRTSSPTDKFRAIATIISGDRPIAVENHLIVLSPKDATFTSCQKLLQNLKDPKTSQWLNKRIRCRHLTISSLSELPWWSD